MYEPTAVVPGSIMPAYKHQFKNKADLDTAYAEAYTVKTVFNTPYDQDLDGDGKVDVALGDYATAIARAKEEAKVIAAGMKNEAIKADVANGQIPEVVALIAYLNSLK
jgi:cytochrome c oxidase cbb3-type subunit 2